MTDKQIIIDGVDVSECDCYYDGKCLCEYNEIDRKIIRYYSCNKFPNCYYKQLKRKEQECEEFRKANDEKNELLAKLGCPTIATARRKVLCLQEQIDKLDQFKADNDTLKETFDGLFKVQYKLSDNNKKLRQCLTEIKEIAERDKEFCNKCDGDIEIDCVDCHEGGRALLAKEILQKISEVEDE